VRNRCLDDPLGPAANPGKRPLGPRVGKGAGPLPGPTRPGPGFCGNAERRERGNRGGARGKPRPVWLIVGGPRAGGRELGVSNWPPAR